MATSGHEQRRRQDARNLETADRSAAEQAPVDLERLEAGQDLSPELMAVLAPQLGNLGLQDALDRQARGSSGNVRDEDEDLALEVGEDEELLEEAEASDIAFGGGGGGAGGSGDPWDVGRLFGGDDDDETPNKPRPRVAPPRPGTPEEEDEEDDLFEDEDEDPDAVEPEQHETVERRLGPLASATSRTGDARYVAVEPALTEVLFLARRALRPEALADLDHPADPLGRPAEVGSFLRRHGRSPRARAIGRLVSRGTGALCPPESGHAAAAARLSTLAVCAEAAEGGIFVDRAVQLALLDEAWPAAVEAARPLSRRGRLRSPLIVAAALGAPLGSARGGRLPAPSPLGGAALREALPPPLLTEVPALDLTRLAQGASEEADPIGQLDAVLLELTGAPAAKAHPVLERSTVAPLLTAARHLMNAVGRGYVEVAAAAIAVLRVHPAAPVAVTVRVADRALTTLAREVLKAGKVLERAVDYRLDALDQEELRGASEALARALVSQQALMGWTFERLAGALDG